MTTMMDWRSFTVDHPFPRGKGAYEASGSFGGKWAHSGRCG
ncbi:hypothetical protein OOK39_33780 [Streptomyces sp. NBC_00264]|nr:MULTISPECIES: hypothetical protein [unclassified Streptomyces]MCX5104748.1 hypothetical protein [Streptomyces sp. NBC_00439]MCX5164201.1 hypothetical protein [Streptomyces sp. NBC_00305]MCX5222725.1 hypothetical protein [Streptomyces sp. NBC_00264]WSP45525.1 hypothetical protein OG348_06485 [Streptomyces sp. NBC_01243]